MKAMTRIRACVLLALGLAAAAAATAQEGRPSRRWIELPPLEEEAAPDSAAGEQDLYAIPAPEPLPFASTSLQETLRANRLREDENSSLVEIFRSEQDFALSLLQVRGEETPRYHLLSDVWIYVWRGRGVLTLADGELDYDPGDLFQIPAGTVHALHNLSGAPTVCLLWQRPPLVDSLTVELPDSLLKSPALGDSAYDDERAWRGGGWKSTPD